MYDHQYHQSLRRMIQTSAGVFGLCLAVGVSAQQTAGRPQPQHTATRMRSSQDTSQAALRAQTKLSETTVRKIAMAKVPHGTIRSSELEREHGHLIYSFDIKVAGKSGIDEVNVDAMTGAVVAHTHETPAAEKREAQQEAAHSHR